MLTSMLLALSSAHATPAFPFTLEGLLCDEYWGAEYEFSLTFDETGCVDCEGYDGTGSVAPSDFFPSGRDINEWSYNPRTRRLTAYIDFDWTLEGRWYPREQCLAMATLTCDPYYCIPNQVVACVGPLPDPLPAALRSASTCW